MAHVDRLGLVQPIAVHFQLVIAIASTLDGGHLREVNIIVRI